MSQPNDPVLLREQTLDLLFLKLYRRETHTNDLRRDGFLNSCFGYVLRGRATLTSATEVLRLGPGELIYIPKGQRYVSHWIGEPEAVFYSLNFEMRATALSGDAFAFQTLKDRGGALRRRFDRLYALLEAGELLGGLGEFYSLYAYLVKLMAPARAPQAPMRLGPALRFLDENSHKDFRGRDLAELCGLGESQFYVLFKAAMGLSPAAYKNRARVKRALELLSDESQSVERVSEALNFSSPSHLRRVLRAHTGLRPKEWRQRVRGSVP